MFKSNASEIAAATKAVRDGVKLALMQLHPDSSVQVGNVTITSSPLEPKGHSLRIVLDLQLIPMDKKEEPPV